MCNVSARSRGRGSFLLLLMLGSLTGCGLGAGPAHHISVNMKSNGEVLAISELVFDNHTATVTTDDEVEKYDLRHESWFDENRDRWVTLSQSQSWTENSVAQSRMSLETRAPEAAKPLLQWMITPRFDVTQEGDVLLLTSGFLDYKITVAPGGPELPAYYKFARLNAYRKAMTLRQQLPLAELLVLKELETRNLLPRRMEVRFPSIPEGPTAVVELTPVDASR